MARYNLPPVAYDDEFYLGVNSPTIPLHVLANDVDPEEALLPETVWITSPAQHGIAEIDWDTGQVLYTPAADYVGEDSFTYNYFGLDSFRYRASDGVFESDEATVFIFVTSTDPLAIDDVYQTYEDVKLFAGTGLANLSVLANDIDPRKANLTAVLVSEPEHGLVTLAADGFFTYIPDLDFNGTDVFTYKAIDLDDESNMATVTIMVLPVNDPACRPQ